MDAVWLVYSVIGGFLCKILFFSRDFIVAKKTLPIIAVINRKYLNARALCKLSIVPIKFKVLYTGGSII
jgi:hypothetical protein